MAKIHEVHDYKKHAADALKYWGYTAGDGLSGVQQSYFQAFVASQEESDVAKDFYDAEMTDWEEKLFHEDGDHTMRVRESLVMSSLIVKCDDSEKA